ncbi:MAG: diguanylate cyclase [Nautilia sp.]|nr:MAG: diguanylate cyclase [Nautilia sp.]
MIEKKDVNLTEDLGEATTKLEIFAKKVLDKMIEENIYPIPYYYSIYFFNMLEDEDIEFKKSVMEIIELESSNELEDDLKFEQQLKKSFKYSKQIVKDTATIYKLSSLLKEKNDFLLKEIDNVATPQVFKTILLNTRKHIEVINKKISQTLKEIKDIYAQNISTLKEIEKESIFDSLYGIYNKKYFMVELEKEIKQIKTLKHISSILVLKVKDDILKKLNTEKTKIIVNRMIAKILLKTSRRTDIVAHLGDGKFGMLLKHTDRIGAIKTSERLSDMISNSTMFIEGEELEIKIVIAIIELTINSGDKVEILNCVYDKLKEVEEENGLYKVCEGD